MTFQRSVAPNRKLSLINQNPCVSGRSGILRASSTDRPACPAAHRESCAVLPLARACASSCTRLDTNFYSRHSPKRRVPSGAAHNMAPDNASKPQQRSHGPEPASTRPQPPAPLPACERDVTKECRRFCDVSKNLTTKPRQPDSPNPPKPGASSAQGHTGRGQAKRGHPSQQQASWHTRPAQDLKMQRNQQARGAAGAPSRMHVPLRNTKNSSEVEM